MSVRAEEALVTLSVEILELHRALPGLASAASHVFAQMAFSQLFKLSFLT